MAYPVPQFIKEETKLMGILNFTQLSILVGYGAVLVLFWFILPKWFWIIIAAIFTPLILAITFGRLNNIYIYKLVGAIIRHLWLPKQYVWEKNIPTYSYKENPSKSKEHQIVSPSTYAKKQLDTQLVKDLSNILDE